MYLAGGLLAAEPDGSAVVRLERGAADVLAAQCRQRGAGGVPLAEDRLLRFDQHGAADVQAIAAGEVQQDQRGLQRRQARVEGGVFA